MAIVNVSDVLKRKNGMVPLEDVAPDVAAPTEAPAEDVKAAITEDPAEATPVINAEHIISLGYMAIANQEAILKLVEIIKPLLEQHGMVVAAIEKLIPQHQAIVAHLTPKPTEFSLPTPPVPPTV